MTPLFRPLEYEPGRTKGDRPTAKCTGPSFTLCFGEEEDGAGTICGIDPCRGLAKRAIPHSERLDMQRGSTCEYSSYR